MWRWRTWVLPSFSNFVATWARCQENLSTTGFSEVLTMPRCPSNLLKTRWYNWLANKGLKYVYQRGVERRNQIFALWTDSWPLDASKQGRAEMIDDMRCLIRCSWTKNKWLASQICKVLGNSNYVMHFKLDEQRITGVSLSPTVCVCDRRDCALSNEMIPLCSTCSPWHALFLRMSLILLLLSEIV